MAQGFSQHSDTRASANREGNPRRRLVGAGWFVAPPSERFDTDGLRHLPSSVPTAEAAPGSGRWDDAALAFSSSVSIAEAASGSDPTLLPGGNLRRLPTPVPTA